MSENIGKERRKAWDVEVAAVKTYNFEDVFGFIIRWDGNIGFGEYLVYNKDGKWVAESEYMDKGEDKEFLKYLMEKFINQIEVIE